MGSLDNHCDHCDHCRCWHDGEQCCICGDEAMTAEEWDGLDPDVADEIRKSQDVSS